MNSQENDEEYEDNLGNENNEDVNKKEEINLENIYDPAHWDTIDSNLIDLLVAKSPIRQVIDFPIDKNSRHFSSIYYIWKLPNEEKTWQKMANIFERVR